MQNTVFDLAILSLLLMLFASIDRVRREMRLRFWLAGWFFILLHFLLMLHSPAGASEVVTLAICHVDLIIATGLCFLISFSPLKDGAGRAIAIATKLAIVAYLLVFLAIADPAAVWPMRVAIVFGELLAAFEANRLLSALNGGPRKTVQVLCFGGGVSMIVTSMFHPEWIPQQLMAEIFMVDAVLLWSSIYWRKPVADPAPSADVLPRRSMGVFATSAGLLTWAAALPVEMVIGVFSPTYATLSPSWNLWNIPKFFAAFGMILMVLEEDCGKAEQLSRDYRLLFERHPLPAWVFHSETLRFLKVNDAAVQHYGFTREEFEAMTIEDIRPPETLPRLRQIVDGADRQISQSYSWPHRTKDGRIIETDIYSHSIRFKGAPARIIIALDVTQRNATESRLRQTYKLESLGQLTGGIAHDFNNLLAIIMGSLEMVEDRTRGDTGTGQMIEQAIVSVKRGADLTKRLLAYARQQPLEPKIVAIGRLIDDTAHFLRRTLGPAVPLSVVAEPGLWQAEIDPNQLENALLNLALNARDAMPDGGTLKIHCRNVTVGETASGLLGEIAAGEYVVISVADTGTGMPEAILVRATEPFFTTKAAGQGTGLGLSMVYGFLRQSGGHMQIESQPGAGTTVLLYLPRAASACDEVPALPTERAATPAFPRGSEIVLVVEDEAAIRRVLVMLLNSLGYRVLEAEDARGAMAHLKAHPAIDLLLTDVILPNGISGPLLAIDARIVQPGIKVLFSSGYTRNALIRERRLEEGVHLLTKPFHLAELANAVRQVLDLAPAL